MTSQSGSDERPRSSFEPNRLEVDLGAIADNAREIRRLVGADCLLYAALKCNAYGLGLTQVAGALLEAAADAVCVARVQDAIALRKAGIAAPVLLYAGAVLSTELVQALEEYDITPTLTDLRTAETVSREVRRELPVFVKVDVGQHRLGFEPGQAVNAVLAVAGTRSLRLDGVYTHMTVPQDPVPDGYVESQFRLFEECLAQIERAGVPVRVRMAASSNVLRLTTQMNLNAIDPGRMFVGLVPPGPASAGVSLRNPIRALRTRLLQVKEIETDSGRPQPSFATRPGMRLGVVALGLADGLDNASAAHVLVSGRRAPLIEPISLEHCRVDLSEHPDASVGDEVVVIGRQGDEEITLDEVVAHRGLSLSASVTIAVRSSVPREYVGA